MVIKKKQNEVEKRVSWSENPIRIAVTKTTSKGTEKVTAAEQKQVQDTKLKTNKSTSQIDGPINLISPSFDFIRQNFKEIFIRLLKNGIMNSLLSLGLVVIIGALCFGIAMAIGITSMENISTTIKGSATVLWIVFGLLIGIGIFGLAWIGRIFELARIAIIEEQHMNKHNKTFDLVKQYVLKGLKLMIGNLGIIAVIVGIPIIVIIGLTFMNISLLTLISMIILLPIMIILLIGYRYFAQFWDMELALTNKGLRESLKASLSLVRKNILGVLAYDVIIVVAAILIAMPFMIVLFIVELVYRVAIAGTMLAFANDTWILLIVGIGAYVIIRTVISLLSTTASDSCTKVYKYRYWKQIRNGE
ncbi:hypothetical protein KKF81_05195 [Candidatus Micrarchaeota archaeon]|nr:hypothetical protein [Candidatus Micrarchaeota archaeon]MBU1166322.1 hypothetical protein [Candidatus Micrarchaeota archaeon]MBU1886426.1 hypothetical protein [Candidatus Micrarchaeota archaeon]